MILIPTLVLLQFVTFTPGLAQTPSSAGDQDQDTENSVTVGKISTVVESNVHLEVDEPANPVITFLNQKLSNDPVDLNDKILQTSDLDEDLLKWEAPIFYQRNVPYYHAGYDHDGRPVWVAEFGKYPVKQFADFKEEDYQVYDKYIRQGSLRLIQSIKAQNTTDREVNDIFLILDFDGLNVYDFASPKSILVVVRLFRAYKDIFNTIVGVCFGINMNYISELAVNIVRPVIGRAFEKVELYGTNSAKWKAALRRRIPPDAIPTWYGGSPDFKPIRVYG